MTDERKIEVFQELLFRGPARRRAALRKALIKGASKPWRHSAGREKEISTHADPQADVIAFARDASKSTDAVDLVLWSCDDGYELMNIVPREVGQLGEHRYNRALRDFVDSIALSSASQAGFAIEVSPAQQGPNDWLSERAADALRLFSAAANKSTGSSHPADRRRWFEFLIAAHRGKNAPDAGRLARWMVQVERWPEGIANDLVIEYEFALDILREYDHEGS